MTTIVTAGLCPVLATVQHGLITEENMSSLAVSTYARTNGTVVDITCYVPSTYKLQGSSQVTCVKGSWVPQPPVCVRKNGLSTDDSNIDDAIENVDSTDDPGSSSIVLMVTASLCALVICMLLAFLIYKLCSSRSKSKAGPTWEPLEDIYYTDGKIPRAKCWGNGVTPIYARSPSYSSSSGWAWIHGTWSSSPRAWTYLSVDRLLRDIERSRRENPRHSWRDFATISTRYSTRRL